MMGRLIARMLGRGSSVRLQHESGRGLLDEARSLLDAGRYAEAEERFGRHLEDEPGDVGALIGLASACRLRGLAEDALEAYGQALALGTPSLGAALDSPRSAVAFLLDESLPADVTRNGPLLQEHTGWIGMLASRLEPDRTRMLAEGIAKELLASPRRLRIRAEKLALLTALLGYERRNSPEWTALIHDTLIEPLFLRALAGGEFETGLILENLIYTHLVLQTETGSHFGRIYRRLGPALCGAGRAHAATLDRLPWPESKRPLVGFLLNNAGILAHAEVLLGYLEALQSAPDRPIDAEVYVLSGGLEGTALASRLQSSGIRAFSLESLAPRSLGERLHALRALGMQRGMQALVWTSAVPCMAFAFSMRVAPVQIWWAMKYHDLECDGTDGCVTGGSTGRFKQIGTRLWRTGPLGGNAWHAPELAGQASQIRAGYLASHDIILAAMGREEKLDSRPFLLAVCGILRRNPRAAFLWTGRAQSPGIQSVFDSEGVSGQCVFIGWVDTRLYAQVIDIFLDSFPFPGGFTAIQAMAAGKPVVLYRSAESFETGLHGLIDPLVEGTSGTDEEQALARTIFAGERGRPLLLSSNTPAEYEHHVQNLIDDAQYRHACGRASQGFVQAFLSNPTRMAESYTRHILEIIEETRARTAGAGARAPAGENQPQSRS